MKSLASLRVLAGVKPALDAAKKQEAEASAVNALTELAAWDGVVDGRPVVTLYEAFEDALWRRTFVDEMGDPLFRVFYEWAGGERPAGLHAVIDERQNVVITAGTEALRRELAREVPGRSIFGPASTLHRVQAG